MNLNLKLVVAMSIALVLSTLLVYQAFVAGFVVSNLAQGSVVSIDSENALLQIDPIEFSAVQNNGGLTISLPAIAPGSVNYGAFIHTTSGNTYDFSAAYLFALVEAEFNYPNNSYIRANLSASLEHVMGLDPNATILILGSSPSSFSAITNFPNNSITVSECGYGQVNVNGMTFAVLGGYGPGASQLGQGSVTIGSGAAAGELIYMLVLLPANATTGTFSAALNLYGYQVSSP
ncbi:hypothetical protein GWK48_07425 [Metallosphaera tengchongensis]|uniref:Uncharacterized protein n=2 Tax=Metallosphaera tengchongensis TaxID=1532350 RepID=A0A6N0NXX7_9CREN|nr:hypothetical protein GWK48_07425 [Metallosphaera tengchongensis]